MRGALGGARGGSTFVDLRARWAIGDGWRLAGSYRRGWTGAAIAGGLDGSGRLATRAFALDLGREGIFGADSAGLRLAAPLRVTSGALTYRLPALWDYATRSVSAWRDGRLDLAPTGRALDAEARYARPLWGGSLATNLFWRRDPGNIAALPDDLGAAARFTLGF